MEEFNKEGKVYKYYKLDDILKLDLVNLIHGAVKSDLKEKFGKNIFFDSNGSCKVGKLIGLEINYQLAMMYYIIEDIKDKSITYVPVYKSITLL